MVSKRTVLDMNGLCRGRGDFCRLADCKVAGSSPWQALERLRGLPQADPIYPRVDAELAGSVEMDPVRPERLPCGLII